MIVINGLKLAYKGNFKINYLPYFCLKYTTKQINPNITSKISSYIFSLKTASSPNIDHIKGMIKTLNLILSKSKKAPKVKIVSRQGSGNMGAFG